VSREELLSLVFEKVHYFLECPAAVAGAPYLNA
jgi:hypothetical protein